VCPAVGSRDRMQFVSASEGLASIDHVVSSSVFDVYDELLVPLIFQAYADDLAERCADLRSGSLLEIAAGTGVATRALATALPDSVTITATDVVPGMLERAQAVGTSRRVMWEPADAMALPYEAESFDAVVCQFGAMFFTPASDAFAEMRRVLRPGGRLVFSVWDALDENDFAAVVHHGVQRHFPDAPPRFLAAKPYAYHDRATIEHDLAVAGFATAPVVDRLAMSSRADTALSVAAGFCGGTPLRDQIEGHGPGALAGALGAVTDAVTGRFGEAPEGQMSAQIVSVLR
jgi:ubiquinone/menaquinone biosynthesis C-methylase UbiE